MKANDFDMVNLCNLIQHFLQTSRGNEEGVPACEDDFPNLIMIAQIGVNILKIIICERFLIAADLFSPEAKAAVNCTGMNWLYEDAIRIAMDKALNRAFKKITDGVFKLICCCHILKFCGDVLCFDGVIWIIGVDEVSHILRNRD